MNQTLKFLFVLPLFVISCLCLAQTETPNSSVVALGDSLLKQGKYDEAYTFFMSNAASASTASKGFFLLKTGSALLYGRKYVEALPYFRLAKDHAQLLGDDKLLSQALINMGVCYTYLGQLAEGVYHYKQALPILSKIKDDKLLGMVNYNLAHSHKERALYDEAILYIHPAIENFEKIGDQHRIARSYSTLGNIYREIGKDSLSIEYHSRSLKISRSINDKEEVSSSLNDLGNSYKALYSYDQALHFYSKSLATGDSVYQATTLGNMAEVYGLQGNFIKSEEYFQKALVLRQREKDVKAVANLLTDLGRLYLNMNKITQAQEKLDNALLLAREDDYKDIIIRNLRVQQDLFIKLGDFHSAYDAQSEVMKVKEEIFDTEGQKIIEQLTIDFEVKDLEKQNILLAEEAKLQKALAEKEKANRGILILILALAFLALAFIGFMYRQSLRRTEWQIAKRQEIQHRTKNFLQTLINFFRFQVNNVDQPDAKAVIKVAQNRLDAMMMIYRSLSTNLDELNFKEYAQELVIQIRNSYMDEVTGVQIKFDTDEIFLNADQATPVAIILNELVSNAFKHAFLETPDPKLLISLKISYSKLVISVQDNGPGIDPEGSKKTESEGLKLTRIFVRQLNGHVELSNNNGTLAKAEVKISRLAYANRLG